MAYKLDSGVRSATAATTTTSDDKGTFSFSGLITWTGPTEFVIDGEYLNENTGAYMVLLPANGLSAVSDMVAGVNEKVNINVFTDIATPGIKAALAASIPLAVAKQTAQDNIVKLFNLDLPAGVELTDLDVTDGASNQQANAQLLLVSAALLQAPNPEQLMENFANELTQSIVDGEINENELSSVLELETLAATVDLKAVAAIMIDKIPSIGAIDVDAALNHTLAFDHNISFINVQDAFTSTVYTSNEATIVGVYGETAPISIIGGTYSVDGGLFASAAGTVANGQKLRVRVTSSSAYSTKATASATIGGGVISYAVSTKSAPISSVTDATPNAFSFGFKNEQAPSALVESDTVKITGINAPAAISIDVGEYKINAGGFTSANGTVSNDDNVTVRHATSGLAGVQVKSTVTIGGVTGYFSTSTTPEDTIPNPFSFANQTDVNATATPVVVSNTVTLGGFNVALPISIVDGNYSVDGGTCTDANGTISTAQTLALCQIPSSSFATSKTTMVTIGSVVASFTTTTMSDPFVADSTPNAFSFASKLDQNTSASVVSDSVTVSGINTDASASIVNGTYSVNGSGSFTDSNVSNGDVIVITQTASANYATQTISALTIGGVSATFKTTTKAQDAVPDAFSFDSNVSIATSTVATSNTVSIAGIDGAIAISISNGEYDVNGAGYVGVDGNVSNGDAVTLRQTSSASQGTPNVTTLTVGSFVRSFTTITQENAPVISGTSVATTPEDSEYSFTPSVDLVNGGEVATWSVTNKPSWITLNTLNGTISGTPSNEDVATYSDINVTATNAQGASSVVIASLEVTNTNDAPTASAASVMTLEETSVEVNATALVSDVDVGDAFAFAVTQPTHGSVTEDNGILTYAPALNYNGADSFTYTATDSGSLASTATVDVNVTAVNDAPTISGTPATSATQDVLYSFGVIGSDVDAGNVLTYSIANNPSWMGINASSGLVSGTPLNADVATTTGIVISVKDDANATADLAAFDVTVANVNDVASIGGTSFANVTEDGVLTASNALTISDIDAGEAELIAQSNVATTYGAFNVDANGTWNYALNNSAANVQALAADENVTDSVVATSADTTATRTITVTITGLNDLASIGGTVAGGVVEDSAMSFSGAVVVDDNDTAQSLVQPIANQSGAYGTFNVDANGSWTYSLTDTPTIQALEQGETLSDGVTLTSYDSTATQDLNVTITGANDAPVAQTPQAYSIKKGSDLNVTLSATDVDNNATLSLTAATATGATVAFDANGSTTFNAANEGVYALNYTFSDEYAATVSGTHTVTVTLSDAPLAGNDAAATSEDVNVSIGVLTNDSDDNTADANLTIGVESAPAHGTATVEADNTITYSPSLNHNGSDSFVYRVTDADGGFATADVNVTISAVNDAPVALNDANTTAEDANVTINVLANDSDVDGDDFNVTAVGSATNGTVSFTPTTVTYSPNANYNGADSFTYTISDGLLESSATVNMTVTPVNDAPFIDINTSTITVLEDSNATFVDMNVSDAENNFLANGGVITVVSSDPSIASVVNNDTNISITPQLNQSGSVTITVSATDGNLAAVDKVIIFGILPVNDAPIAVDDNLTALSFVTTTFDILANDSDVDTNALTIESCTTPTNGSVTTVVNATQLLYTSLEGFSGGVDFNCTISDSNLTSTEQVHVTVTLNHAPTVALPIVNLTMLVGETISGNVMANDADANDTLTYAATTVTANLDNVGTTLDLATGDFSVTATGVGPEQLIITVTDDGSPNLSVTATYNINVTLPQANSDQSNYSQDNTTYTVADFNTIAAIATPGDTPLHTFWGTTSTQQGVILSHDSMEFVTSLNKLAFSDGGDGWYNGALTGALSIAFDGLSYDVANEVARYKTIAEFNSTQIATDLNLSMPASALGHQSLVSHLTEQYDFWQELLSNGNVGDTYASLGSFVDAVGSVATYNETNYKRVLIFDSSDAYSARTGNMVEVDMTGGDPYVINPNAGTWDIVRSVSVDANSSDILRVAPTDSTRFKTSIFVLDNFNNNTGTVWRGSYGEANRVEGEFNYNGVAAAVIENDFSPVTPAQWIARVQDSNVTELNATTFGALGDGVVDLVTASPLYEAYFRIENNVTTSEMTQSTFSAPTLTNVTFVNGELNATETLSYSILNNVATLSFLGTNVYEVKIIEELNATQIQTLTGMDMSEGSVAYKIAGLQLVNDTSYYGDAQAFDNLSNTYTYTSLATMLADVQPQNSKGFAFRNDGVDSFVLAFEDNNATVTSGNLVDVNLSDMSVAIAGTWDLSTISVASTDVVVINIYPDNSAFGTNLIFSMNGGTNGVDNVQAGDIQRAGTGSISYSVNQEAKDIVQANFYNGAN